MIEKMTENDIPQILELWKKEDKVLGIPFKATILDLIHRGHFLCIKNEDGIIMCMCGFKVMKRERCARIVKLCTREEYRGRGLAVEMISHIYSIIKKAGIPLHAECMEGAQNNTFYSKIGTLIHRKKCKTMNVLTYNILPYKLRR